MQYQTNRKLLTINYTNMKTKNLSFQELTEKEQIQIIGGSTESSKATFVLRVINGKIVKVAVS